MVTKSGLGNSSPDLVSAKISERQGYIVLINVRRRSEGIGIVFFGIAEEKTILLNMDQVDSNENFMLYVRTLKRLLPSGDKFLGAFIIGLPPPVRPAMCREIQRWQDAFRVFGLKLQVVGTGNLLGAQWRQRLHPEMITYQFEQITGFKAVQYPQVIRESVYLAKACVGYWQRMHTTWETTQKLEQHDDTE